MSSDDEFRKFQAAVLDSVQQGAQALHACACMAVEHVGAGPTVFIASDSGEKESGEKLRTVLFLSSGTFSDDDLARLQKFCLGAMQDANMGVETKIVRDDRPEGE